MSHHASGPDFGFPRGDARLDMTDLYAFPKPGSTGKSILVLNVHPSFALNPPGPTTAEPFAPGALYEFKIDTDGDAIADICYVTVPGSGVPAMESRPRRCAVFRAREPPERAMKARSSSTKHRSQPDRKARLQEPTPTVCSSGGAAILFFRRTRELQ